jgi:hypothetical protein
MVVPDTPLVLQVFENGYNLFIIKPATKYLQAHWHAMEDLGVV